MRLFQFQNIVNGVLSNDSRSDLGGFAFIEFAHTSAPIFVRLMRQMAWLFGCCPEFSGNSRMSLVGGYLLPQSAMTQFGTTEFGETECQAGYLAGTGLVGRNDGLRVYSDPVKPAQEAVRGFGRRRCSIPIFN